MSFSDIRISSKFISVNSVNCHKYQPAGVILAGFCCSSFFRYRQLVQKLHKLLSRTKCHNQFFCLTHHLASGQCLRQQSVTPLCYLRCARIELPRVPRIVDDLVWTPGVLHEIINLPLRILPEDPPHVEHILLIHPDQKIIRLVIQALQLPRPMRADRHTPSLQRRLHRRINRIPDLLRRRRRRIDHELRCQPPPVHHILKYILRRNAATDVAMAEANRNLRFSFIFKISFNLFIYNNSYRCQNQ